MSHANDSGRDRGREDDDDDDVSLWSASSTLGCFCGFPRIIPFFSYISPSFSFSSSSIHRESTILLNVSFPETNTYPFPFFPSSSFLFCLFIYFYFFLLGWVYVYTHTSLHTYTCVLTLICCRNNRKENAHAGRRIDKRHTRYDICVYLCMCVLYVRTYVHTYAHITHTYSSRRKVYSSISSSQFRDSLAATTIRQWHRQNRLPVSWEPLEMKD